MPLHTMKPVLDPDGHVVRTRFPTIKFNLLNENAKLPIKATGGAACYDLYSDMDFYFSSSLTSRVVSTGVAVELPPGHVGLVCSRSGLAANQNIFVLNAPGVIDEDYRGELKVILGYLPTNVMGWPSSKEPLVFSAGARIAQLLVLKTTELTVVRSADLSTTERGDGGLGSTGV